MVHHKSNNWCTICDKDIYDVKSAIYVKCINLPSKPHGENCDCELLVGNGCYRKIMKECAK